MACFYAGGPLQRELADVGIPVFDLRKHGRWEILRFLWRLGCLIKTQRPKILHSYLPVPNLVALLLRLLNPKMKVVWGVRASNVGLASYDWSARVVFWLECRLAGFADLIIVNSRAGLEYHIACAYPRSKMCLIQNGIDTDRFAPDPEGGLTLRQEWGVPDKAILVGLVGRLDPMKDHNTFLQAAAALREQDTRWYFVCIGDGPADYTANLIERANALGLAGRLVWTGALDEMAAIYSALDIVSSSSSFGEGFPNVVAEAMACGRPCVVTDVGDSAEIVGELGVVVPPRDPLALAAGIQRLEVCLEQEGEALRNAVREHIEKQFRVTALVERTVVALSELLYSQVEA
ncbi:MAG: glycosyltransferase, partial [Candidatus Saccharimonadales bacterium]